MYLPRLPKARRPRDPYFGNYKLYRSDLKLIRSLKRQGYYNWEIAEHLGVSESHVGNLLNGRFQVSNRRRP